MKSNETVVNLIFKKDFVQECAPNEWMFTPDPKSMRKILPDLDAAEDLMMEGEFKKSEQKFRKIIKEMPDCIEAHNGLYHCLCYQDQEIQAFKDLERTLSLISQALPEKIFTKEQRVAWGFIDNRAFLRLYASLGMAYFEANLLNEAKPIFEQLMAWNPNDNQGIREYLIETYFKLKDPDSVLGLCSHYPEDALAGVIYGRPLALCMKGDSAKARKALKNAIEYLPRVAEELLKEKHPKPKGLDPSYITVGGEDEAYCYWKSYGKFWKKNELAMNLLKENEANLYKLLLKLERSSH